MKVVIINAYDRLNSGDAALMSAAISQIESAFRHPRISYAGLEDSIEHPDFAGAANLGSIRRWAGDDTISRPHRVLRKVAALCLLVTPAFALRALAHLGRTAGHRSEPLRELSALRSADLVVGLGGGYLNGTEDLAGTLNIAFLLLPIVLSSRLKRPVALAPQSYGPFGSRLQLWLVKRVLNRLPQVVAREDNSLRQLIEAGVEPDRLVRGVDSAFVPLAMPPLHSVGTNRLRVGVTVRDWLTGEHAVQYETALAQFIDWLGEQHGADVILIAQVTSSYHGDDDRPVSRRIAERCRTSPEVMLDRVPYYELRRAYADLDVLVGTRFHSVIFGLTAGTPAIAIEYEPKTSGIMNDLGLGDWVIPIANVDFALLRKTFEELEHKRADYLRQLNAVLPAYQQWAGEFVELMRQAVDPQPAVAAEAAEAA
jgi:colanic acid/amylovoran biosynthesis protein